MGVVQAAKLGLITPMLIGPADGPRALAKTEGADLGDFVAEYALRLYEIREAKQKVKFVGRCASACTLFLALPTEQTCITEGAYFRFHSPSAPPASAVAAVAAYMMRKYPKWVRAWIVAQGGLSDRLAAMSYEYANKFMRTCDLAGR